MDDDKDFSFCQLNSQVDLDQPGSPKAMPKIHDVIIKDDFLNGAGIDESMANSFASSIKFSPDDASLASCNVIIPKVGDVQPINDSSDNAGVDGSLSLKVVNMPPPKLKSSGALELSISGRTEDSANGSAAEPKIVKKKPPVRAKVPFEKGYSQMDWLKLTQTHPDLAACQRKMIGAKETLDTPDYKNRQVIMEQKDDSTSKNLAEGTSTEVIMLASKKPTDNGVFYSLKDRYSTFYKEKALVKVVKKASIFSFTVKTRSIEPRTSHCLKILFIDGHGNRLQGACFDKVALSMQNDFLEGEAYYISGFQLTKADFQYGAFDCTNDIRFSERTNLVGKVCECSEIELASGKRKRVLKLQNKLNQHLWVVVWPEVSHQEWLEEFSQEKDDTVIMITAVRAITKTGGTPIASTSFSVIIVEPELTETAEIRTRFRLNVSVHHWSGRLTAVMFNEPCETLYRSTAINLAQKLQEMSKTSTTDAILGDTEYGPYLCFISRRESEGDTEYTYVVNRIEEYPAEPPMIRFEL